MLSALQKGVVEVKPLPRFPAIQRDLSIIGDESIRWSDIIDVVKSKASDELEDVQYVEIYRGKGVPSGKKSVTLTLRFRDEDGTLTHETVNGFQEEIVNGLTESLGTVLRDS